MARFSLKSVLTLALGSALTLPAVFAAGEISGALTSLITTLSDFFGNVVPQLDNVGIYRLIYWIVVFAVSRYLFKFTVFKASGGDDQKKAMSNLAVTLAAVVASIGAIMTPQDILTFIFSLYAGLLSLIVILFILGVLIYNVYQKDFLKDMPALNQFTKAALLAICVFILTYLTDLYGTLMPYLAVVAPFMMLLMTAMIVWSTIGGISSLFSGTKSKGAPTEKTVTDLEDTAAKDTKKLLADNEESVAAHKAQEDAKKAAAKAIDDAEKKGADAQLPPQFASIEELSAKDDIKEFNDSQKSLDDAKRIYGVFWERAQTLHGKFSQTNNQQGFVIIGSVHSSFLDMEAKIKSYQKIQSDLAVAMQKKRELEAEGRTFRDKKGTIKKGLGPKAKANFLQHTQASKIVGTLEQAIVGLQTDIGKIVNEKIGPALEQGAKIAGTPNATQAIK